MSVKNDFFSNTNPDLISAKSFNELDNILVVSETAKKMSSLGESAKDFYKKFIQPNVIPIIILLSFIIFMIYRYMTKKNENFNPSKHPSDKTQTKLELSEVNPHVLDNIINSYVNDPENEELEGQINEEEILNECQITKKIITSSKWNKCFPSDFKEIHYKNSNYCTFEFIINIIEKKTGTKFSDNNIRKILYLSSTLKEYIIKKFTTKPNLNLINNQHSCSICLEPSIFRESTSY